MCTGIGAAELGEFAVGSHIGQQVVADIELTGIENPGATVQVRLASADVYRGANIDMPAVLSSLNMNVMRRDGKQFLHVTSLKPVEADHLHLFVELTDGARRSVRLATLWFTPDPTPPAPLRPAQMVAAAEPAVPPPRKEPAPPKAAVQPRSRPVIPEPEPAPAPVHKALQPRAARVPHATEPALPSLPRKAPEPGPVAAQLAKPSTAPACKPQPAAAPQPDPVCEALDQKNSDLRDQIARLEQKVKLLQGDAKRKVLDPLAMMTPHLVKAKPGLRTAQPAAAKPPALPNGHVVAAQPQPPALPWGWIAGAGAAVFALIGTIRFWRMKRAKAKADQKATMKARARPVPLDPAAPVEPTLG
jgi:pilus assembly protein FimV